MTFRLVVTYTVLSLINLAFIFCVAYDVLIRSADKANDFLASENRRASASKEKTFRPTE